MSLRGGELEAMFAQALEERTPLLDMTVKLGSNTVTSSR